LLAPILYEETVHHKLKFSRRKIGQWRGEQQYSVTVAVIEPNRETQNYVTQIPKI
jgi:hypothetical protein